MVNRQTPNPAVERTCAKSRAGRSLLRWVRSFPFAYPSAHAQPARKAAQAAQFKR